MDDVVFVDLSQTLADMADDLVVVLPVNHSYFDAFLDLVDNEVKAKLHVSFIEVVF